MALTFRVSLDERDPQLLLDAFSQAKTRGDRQVIAKTLMLLGAVTLRNAQSSPVSWPSPNQLRLLLGGEEIPTAHAPPVGAAASQATGVSPVTAPPSQAGGYAPIPDDVFESLSGGYTPLSAA